MGNCGVGWLAGPVAAGSSAPTNGRAGECKGLVSRSPWAHESCPRMAEGTVNKTAVWSSAGQVNFCGRMRFRGDLGHGTSKPLMNEIPPAFIRELEEGNYFRF